MKNPNYPLIVNSGGRPINTDADDMIETVEGLEEEVKKLNEEVGGKIEELKEEIEKANTAVTENSSAYKDIIKNVSALSDEVRGIMTKITNLQQKQSRFDAGIKEIKQSLGAQFTNMHKDGLRALNNKKGSLRMEIKNAITSLPASAGALITPDRRDMVPTPMQQVWVRDLLASGTTNSNMIEYPRMNSFTNNAAPVAETTPKPESNMNFVVENAPVRTIAHWIIASKQVLDDVPQLESLINNILLYGLKLVEDQQFLFGDGTGENLEGIMTVATDFDETLMTRLSVTNPQRADRIRAAILQVITTSMLPADGIVLNPIDGAALELIKDTNGNYLKLYDENGRIWRLRATESPSMEEDEFLVGAFNAGAQVFDREEAAVEVSTEDGDNFRRNMVTIRAEERLALAIYFTNAFVKSTFTPAP